MLNGINKNTIRLFVFSILLFLVVSGVYAGGYTFLQARQESVRALLRQAQEEMNRSENTHITRLLVKDTEQERLQIDKYFVTSDTLVDFIERIERIGAAAGVSFELSAVNIEEKDGRETLVLKFGTRGSWHDTYYLLALVESLPMKIEIERVSMRKQAAKKGLNIWRGDFTIRILSFLNT